MSTIQTHNDEHGDVHGITLRKATPDDVGILSYWDTKQHNIDSDPNDDWNWNLELRRDFSWREQLIAELNGRPIGFLQIIDPFEEESHYWGDVEENLRAIDIWIGEEEDLGKGYGTIMMKLAIERCFSQPEVKGILIDPLASNTKAHRFYERLGFKFQERRQFNEDDCFVYKYDRVNWEISR